jgi:hypothetical protein
MSDDDDIVHIDGSIESMAANAAAIDRPAILRAAEALRRDEATLDHMMDLHVAVLRFRGPYAIALEREVNNYMRRTGWRDDAEGLNAHMATKRDELRSLFRADIAAVVREAEGQ